MRRTLLFLALAFPAVAAPPPPVTALAYHPSGKLLAAGTRDYVALLDPAKGGAVAYLGGQTGRVTALAFSRDGKRLAVASGEPARSGVIRLYSVTDGKAELAGELTGPKDVQYTLDFAPDHRTLASAGYDRVIRLWDCETRKPLRELTDHSDTVYAVGFSPDGKLLASASADRAVKVWDPATGKRLHTLSDSTDWVYALAWHPAGRELAAAGVDKSLRVWEVSADAAKLVRSAFAHTEPVTRIAYSTDGEHLYSASEGKSLKKWDAAKLVEEKVFPPQPDTVLSLAVSPDGKQVAVGRFDGVLQLVDSDSGRAAPATSPPLTPPPRSGEGGGRTGPPGHAQRVGDSPLPASGRGAGGERSPPTINKLTPNFGPRGKSTKVNLEGQRLDGELTVTAPVPGVTVKLLTASATKAELDVSVAADVAPGPVALTVKAAGGSASTTFIVDRYPVTTDAGAIDSARTGRTVTLPATLVGTIDRAGQADYFRFKATAGQGIGVQVLTAAIGSKLDAVLELADADGRVLAEGTAGLLAFTCPADGNYAIGVRDKEYRGAADMFYRLHVGDFPVVSGVHPMGVRRGTKAAVTLVGVNLPVKTAEATVPADAAVGSRVPVPLPTKGEKPLGDPAVVVGEFPEVTVERGMAAVQTPGTANGVLGKPGETHQVRFAARKGERLLLEVNARRAGSPLDPFVEVLDRSGKPVGRATLRATARTFVVFRDHDSAGAGIRIEAWNELAMNDYVMLGNELLRIAQLPLNPDADCTFDAVNGQRVGFLDTTPTHHPNGEPLYKVEVHPPGTTFPPNGLPVFHLTYRNDDGGPGYGKDSRLFFDPPADGEYTVRIGDARGEGGPAHGYRLTVRRPRPDFTVSLNPTAPAVWKGGAVPVAVTVNRIDGYDGPVQVRLENLPPGFEAPATFIEAGQQSTALALYAAPTASSPAKAGPIKLVGRATIDGKEVVREAAGGVPTLVEPGDLATATAVGEVTIRPGSEARLAVKVERRNGFKGRVPVEVRGLPHGVRVLDVGLNGILVTERDTEREVAIYAEPWVKPMEHPFVVLSKREGKNTEHAAKSVLLKVQK